MYVSLIAASDAGSWSSQLGIKILAYYAYALGRLAECLSHLEDIPDFTNFSSRIPAPASIRTNASVPQVPHEGTESSFSSWPTVFAASESAHISEVKDGRAWAMAETFRSICLHGLRCRFHYSRRCSQIWSQGMSHEKLDADNQHKALAIYGRALPLLKTIETELTSLPNPIPASGKGPGKFDFTSFTVFRELWRWVERLLWRAIVIAARIRQDLWMWLSHYSSCSKYWPADFRADHRCAINTIYLRALILSPPSSSTVNRDLGKPPPWLQTARSVVNEYRALLTVSTQFPGAGERNVKVEEFVDLCVALWEASGAIGEHAGWVIDVSQRDTFPPSTIS